MVLEDLAILLTNSLVCWRTRVMYFSDDGLYAQHRAVPSS
jgi:hypothetical protein